MNSDQRADGFVVSSRLRHRSQCLLSVTASSYSVSCSLLVTRQKQSGYRPPLYTRQYPITHYTLNYNNT